MAAPALALLPANDLCCLLQIWIFHGILSLYLIFTEKCRLLRPRPAATGRGHFLSDQELRLIVELHRPGVLVVLRAVEFVAPVLRRHK